jgi:thiamine-monophosphate kinase
VSSEFARIALIEAIVGRASADVALGIGDDCAVLHPSGQVRVWTVDAAVEGVHFSRSLMSLEQAGYRAFMAAASDLAAMGARAVAALSALTLPVALSDQELTALTEGLARAADLCACPIVGGNLTRADQLTLTTSVIGECPAKVLTRSGARPGDGIYLSGAVGGAALGLQALRLGRGGDARFAAAIGRFLEPRARLDIALSLAELASAAIDVSDGLAQDLGHLCRASGVGARIDCAALPALSDFLACARALGCDPLQLALSGGEDYEIVFSSSAAVPESLAVRIGVVTDQPARVLALDAAGREVALESGFDHFAGS